MMSKYLNILKFSNFLGLFSKKLKQVSRFFLVSFRKTGIKKRHLSECLLFITVKYQLFSMFN